MNPGRRSGLAIGMKESGRQAAARSQQCPHCGGSGLVTIRDRDDRGQRVEGRTMGYPRVIMTHCLCPFGAWMRARTSSDVRDWLPDLAEILAGRTRWMSHDPRDEARGQGGRDDAQGTHQGVST